MSRLKVKESLKVRKKMAKLIEITGKALSGEWGKDDETGNGVPVLRTTNFTNEGIIDYNSVVTRTITKKNIGEKFLRKGDIIIEKSGGSDKFPVGRVVYFDGDDNTYLFNNFTGLLRVKEPKMWYPRYVFYSLFANYKRGGTRMFENKTTGLHNLKTDDYVSRYEVTEIDIIEQVSVCDKLDKLYEIINERKQQLELLDELVKARFVEMFGTLHDNENGFDIVIIEDVCSLIKDGTHQTPQYTEDKKEGYKFLSSKDVMSQKVDWTNIKYIPAELHEKLYATIKPQRNDILMSKNGVNYGVAAVNDTDEVFDIYVSLALLRPKKIIDPVFLKCVINNPETKWQFDSSIKGIGVPNLHLGEIKKTRMFLPPIELQNQFADFVRAIDKSKVNYYYKNRKDGFPPLLLIYSVTTIINLSDY